MKCPFCYSRLISYHHHTHAAYVCEDEACVNDGMPRYQIIYNNYPTYLMGRTFMLDKYYIQIDFKRDITTISVLEGCILLDSIRISKAMSLDLSDPISAAEKVKTLMVFS